MPTCTFFGHHDCPSAVAPLLHEAVEDLILHQGVDDFYVGHQGHFDAYALSALRKLSVQYPHIRYAVVLSYLPNPSDPYTPYQPHETLYPEEVAKGIPRFAINRRNDWMLKRATHVLAYVAFPTNGAPRYVEKAIRQGKQVRNLHETLATSRPEQL